MESWLKFAWRCCAAVMLWPAAALAASDPAPRAEIRIGFIGSLSGFASAYGQEALAGVKLAVEAADPRRTSIILSIEDDASDIKNTITAFRKLSSGGAQALITGTWWANSIVKLAEAQALPLVSIETSFNLDTVPGATYFMMLGDLQDWVRVYEPLIAKRGWKRGAVIHFTSGFGQTLAAAMRETFSSPGRSFVGDIEYADIDASEARALALRLKTLNADVVYIDGQPSNLASIIKRIQELKLTTAILTNSIAEDMCAKDLVDCAEISGMYFNKRKPLTPAFASKYNAAYGSMPYLDGDLAYYSMLLLLEAMKKPNPVEFIKSGQAAPGGVKFSFDGRNAFTGLEQEVWSFEGGKPIRVMPE